MRVLGHVTVLVNPLAGRGRARRVAGRAIAELRRSGVDVDVVGQSVSAECVRHAPCPVVIIPGSAATSP